MDGESKKSSGKTLGLLPSTSTNDAGGEALNASRSFSHKISDRLVLTMAKPTPQVWNLRDPQEARAFIKSIRHGKKQIHWIVDDFGGRIPVDKATDEQIMIAIKHIAKAMRKGEAAGEDH